MTMDKTSMTGQAEDARRMLIEECAKRIEAYALSLELSRHRGLPDAVSALSEAATKLRAL